MMSEFKESLRMICDLYDALEYWPRKTVSVMEIALAIGKTRNETIALFDLLNLRPSSWESPSDYDVAAIREECCRHETSARF
jgi:hypothetical protein